MNCNNKFPVECKKEVYLAGVLGIEANGIVNRPDEDGIIKLTDIGGPGYEVITQELAPSQRVTTEGDPATGTITGTMPSENPRELEVNFNGTNYTLTGENGVYEGDGFTVTLGETATLETTEPGTYLVEIHYKETETTQEFQDAVDNTIESMTYEEVMAVMEGENG